MDQEKVAIIIGLPNPKSVSDVKSFHGLTSFYIRFESDKRETIYVDEKKTNSISLHILKHNNNDHMFN